MAPPKPDRRIARTRQSLHQAHMALMREKGYEATTISEIVSRANVGRSTFYAHYGSKETLALSGLDHLRSILLTHQRTALESPNKEPGDRLAFSRSFFEHLGEYREVFRSLLGNSAEGPALKKLRRILADLIGKELPKSECRSRSAIPRDAALRFTVEAFLSVLFWWMDESPNTSASTVDQIFRRLTSPAFAAAAAE